jgi:hypothetical protein
MANGYYTHSTYPATNSAGSSAAMRAELDAVMAGFGLLPDPLGLGQKGFTGGSWNNPVVTNGTFTLGTLDAMVLGGVTPAAAHVTTLGASGAVTLASGGSLTGTFTGIAGAILSAFAITGGSINNAPIGATTPNTGSFTQLTVSGSATFNGPIVTTGGFASGSGSLELGSTSASQLAYIDFHSSGQNLDYDARIGVVGGGGTLGQGAMSYTAASHAFNTRPTFAGAVPWDAGNLPNPFQTTGGHITGATTFDLRPTFNGSIPWDHLNLPSPFQTTGGIITGATQFSSRPTFNGATPWDTSNFNPGSYVAFGQTATYADSALALRSGANPAGSRMVFNWSGQGGQPQWVWGGADGVNMYVYNPSNFSVSWAANAGAASSVGGVSNPATNGSTCQWTTGIVEFGPLTPGGTMNASAPYVMVGWRTTDSGFLSVNDGGHNWIRCVALRNQ